MTKKFEPQLKVVQIGDAYVREVLDEYKVELDLGVEKAIIDWNAYPEGKPEQVAEDYGGRVVIFKEVAK